MKPNEKYSKLATEDVIQKTAKALMSNNFNIKIVDNGEEAKKEVLQLIPPKAEVFTMSSQTLEEIGVDSEINESDKYNAIRPKLLAMDRNTQAREMVKLGAAPEWVVASVQAVTEDGHLLIASNTGSQLSAEAYAASKVIFVIGSQKIVKDTNEGIKRIYEYCLPLEDARARKVYGMPSAVNKILIINKEVIPDRITVILVKQRLGF
jgi:hypothetical protein